MQTANLKNHFAACILLLVIVSTASGDIISVNPGESIQAAIDSAFYGDTVDVAAGTYTERITLKNGVAVIGAGAGISIIDGNAGGSVVTSNGCDANTVLEGFTLTDGLAANGGGMYNVNSSPAINDCIFSGNRTNDGSAGVLGQPGGHAGHGGGMYNNNSSPAVTNCTFQGNSTGVGGNGGDTQGPSLPGFVGGYGGDGGGIYNTNNSTPILVNCIFSGNAAGAGGNGADGGDGIAIGMPGGNGGAGGSGGEGGGVYNNNSTATLINCIFNSNSGGTGGNGGYGGDAYIDPVIDAQGGDGGNGGDGGEGGGVYNNNCSPVVTNCTFSGNSCGAGGLGGTGGAGVPAGADGADGFDGTGGGIYNKTSLLAVTNCILWGDTPDEISNSSASPTVTYSDVEGGTGQAWFGTGCIEADPLFIASLHLPGGSPCIDAGDNGAVPLDVTEDIEGSSRIVDGDFDSIATVDMGAYEYRGQQPMEVWVDDDYTAGGVNDGHSWGYDAFALIEDGINAAGYGTTVHVAGGRYMERMRLKNGVALIGAGADSAVIDAGGSGRVVYSSGCNKSTILEGFTVTNGNALGSWPNNSGGGMCNYGSSPTVTNCTFNSSDAIYGGGMYNDNGSNPTIVNCTFSGNSAQYGGGGGMCNFYQSSPTLTNCTFIGNTADLGGGMYNFSNNSRPTVTNCTFTGNSAQDYGGGMWNGASSPTVTNCTFSGNSSQYGGGMYNSDSTTVTNCKFIGNSAYVYGGGMHNEYYSNPTVTNCTFSNNSAENGGGMGNLINSSPTVTNCIMWGDSADTSGDEIYNDSSTPTISYSDIAGCVGSGTRWNGSLGADGGGNIDAEPLFFAPAINDYHLKSEFGRVTTNPLMPHGSWSVDAVTSPCIDAGDPDMDVGNEPEGNGNRINMGAYGGTYQASKSSYGETIDGDVNGDGKVDFRDIAIVAGNWLAGK